ncbi:MAG: hypothetical protein FRX48_01372 [Lasallia pustulata]|uniref:S-adenosyl-L-methionine-dependent methyltransferase-like n=1 Tax=Lasallia pustulata TaxID=136370 RepID=A0A5M8PZT1_9LECA|nr:MAG: hypothetical protein FRX48_01372 [Lasallia pustulata]
MPLQGLLGLMGDEVTDADEESFLLFSQDLPSQDLGFVDAKASTLELTVASKDMTIHQSPPLLSSNRGGGTTGAVIWRVTPLFAEWISSPTNILFRQRVLTQDSVVLELGCGISGIVALTLLPRVKRYLATDQGYVLKLLNENLAENTTATQSSAKPAHQSSGHAGRTKPRPIQIPRASRAVETMALDWELDSLAALPGLLKVGSVHQSAASSGKPTLCIVAQQLRSPTVFHCWLSEFQKAFNVWRVPDELLTEDLKENSGFVMHVGLLHECKITLMERK